MTFSPFNLMLGTGACFHLYFFQFLQCISLSVSKIFLLLNTLHTRLASSPYELRLSTGACWQGGGGGGGRATGGKGERPVTWLKQLVAANHRVFVSIHHLYFSSLSQPYLSSCNLCISLIEGRGRGQSPSSSNWWQQTKCGRCLCISVSLSSIFPSVSQMCFSLCKKYFF